MVRLGDFEVTVVSPGIRTLPEFVDPDAVDIMEKIKGPGMVRYLQATSNTMFSLELRIFSRHRIEADSDIVIYVSRDGDRRRLADIIVMMNMSMKTESLSPTRGQTLEKAKNGNFNH